MAKLILIRHGKSEWNLLGKWTGFTDIGLVEEGVKEAQRAGKAIQDISIDCAFISDLKRAQETFTEICRVIDQPTMKSIVHPAIKERNYGVYTGKNKWEVKEEIGEEAFQKLRRGWDVKIPEGETLKDVHARVVPYYEQYILPELKSGKNILVVAHGNSLRALVKHLEDIPDDKISELEIGTGEVYIYDVSPEGEITGKEIRAANESKGRV
ncbi:MAG: 2,3-diphosphoglycerate-dependent phosphoglycerate mutase [Candidatus Kaiserbacteria bacterium]|nr:MAG: 2,3-diphosphoglycerate-dependent phosphoglycerate mutase [Candidatus Kaiserbacteria bacterium]